MKSLLLPTNQFNEFGSRFRTNYTLPDQGFLDRKLGKLKLKLFMYSKKNVAFLGRLLCSITFEWDTKIPTACTNGIRIVFNPYFFLAMSEKERAFVLYHELWHIALLHCGKIKDLNQEVWNIATDYVINNMAYEDGLIDNSGILSSIQFEILFEPKYAGWSSERVYEDLLKSSKIKSKKGQVLDQLEPEPEGQAHKVATAVVQAYQTAKLCNKAGELPGDFIDTISKFLNPVMPWEAIFQNFFNELANDDYSYRRPNKRYTDIILPTLVSDGRLDHIVWFFDTSGSISDSMLLRFSSEMAYVYNTHKPSRMTFIQFDAKIQKIIEYEDDVDITDVVIRGRGGTNLGQVEQWLHKYNPNAAVIMTDLYCDPMRQDPNIPIIWAVSGNDRPSVPFGKIITLPTE